MASIQTTKRIAEEDIPKFRPDLMVKLLSTIDEQQHPNLVLIISLEAKDRDKVMFGEFITGKSKRNLELNSKCCTAFMTLANEYWVIKGDFTDWAYEGADYEYYSEKPLFKNNAYTGIARVAHINVKEVFSKRKVKLQRPLLRVLKGFKKETAPSQDIPELLPAMVDKIFRGPSNLKYLAFVDADGYPLIIPTMHLLPAEGSRLIFTPADYKEDISKIQSGTFVTTYTLYIEELLSYQVKGTYQGLQPYQDIEVGVINIEEVYCTMPPKAGDRIV